jgi:hypothetical protein
MRSPTSFKMLWANFIQVRYRARSTDFAPRPNTHVRPTWTVVDSVRNLLTRCEVQYGTGCTRSHVLLKRLGDILMISGRYDEVEEAGYQLMFRANDIGDAQLWRMGSRLVARAQYQQNKAEEAEESYRELLHAYAAIMGWRDPGTIRYMLDLEECLTGIGKLEAAEHIKAERLNLVSTMTDVLLP